MTLWKEVRNKTAWVQPANPVEIRVIFSSGQTQLESGLYSDVRLVFEFFAVSLSLCDL